MVDDGRGGGDGDGGDIDSVIPFSHQYHLQSMDLIMLAIEFDRDVNFSVLKHQNSIWYERVASKRFGHIQH